MEQNTEQMKLRKYELIKVLSNLENQNKRNVYFEQYSTDVDIAVDILYTAFKDIVGRDVADFGCGNGIFSIGLSIMNAKKVYCVEMNNIIEIARKNANNLNLQNIEFLKIDVEKFDLNVDTVIMNPPFGYRNRGLDMKFFNSAMKNSDNIYFLYTSRGEDHLKKVFGNYMMKDFSIYRIKNYKLMIPFSYAFHEKVKKYIDVSLYLAKVI